MIEVAADPAVLGCQLPDSGKQLVIDVYHAEKQDGVTNQQVVIHYNCIGAFEVPDRKKIPEADIIMETRKGVAVSYAPAQIAV
nr:DUF4368 domain-containing protein [Intestinimonas butyriciproducens]